MVTAIVGANWGDEGKGKTVSLDDAGFAKSVMNDAGFAKNMSERVEVARSSPC